MDAWPEKRTVQTMNLRSVFTPEQQRILERYYDNGMTNQSKSCFQLILQCAQETKLDFSVVRTWVGNKRRKLASKADQNGGAAQGPASHTLAGAVGGSVGAGTIMTPEIAAARGTQRAAHLLPPPVASSLSSPLSSSPSSCSSHSSGSVSANGSNNDVIVTGIYSLARTSSRLEPSTQARTTAKALPLHTEAEMPAQVGTRSALQVDTSVLHSRLTALPRKVPQLSSSCGPALQARKAFPPTETPAIARAWARQSWPFSSQAHTQSTPSSMTTAVHSASQPCASDPGVRVQQVFSLATLGNGLHRSAPESSLLRAPVKTQPVDSMGCFSIAMETGDADDEYAKEEELASMGAQIQMCPTGGSSGGVSSGTYAMGRGLTSGKSASADAYVGKGHQTAPSLSHCPPRQSSFFSSTAGSRGSYPAKLPQQSSLQTASTLQASGSLSAPWITSNSRKRTLQDRTQFSDRDLRTLKKYWDNGMTSLGSVCREKISAAANELGVDSEIIKTWIGNRRRKYRLMGIEIALPKGGPPAFIDHSCAESPRSLTSDGDEVKTSDPGEDSEQNDEVSICLSEGENSPAFIIHFLCIYPPTSSSQQVGDRTS